MSTQLQGQRIYPNDEGHLVFSEPGMYGQDQEGVWWMRPPRKGFSVGKLTLHQIVVNSDQTITVSPSILAEGHNGTQWHGYLENGTWREV